MLAIKLVKCTSYNYPFNFKKNERREGVSAQQGTLRESSKSKPINTLIDMTKKGGDIGL